MLRANLRGGQFPVGGVLTETACKNKRNSLYGLKENVIFGKMISAGTGLNRYRDKKLVPHVVTLDEDDSDND